MIGQLLVLSALGATSALDLRAVDRRSLMQGVGALAAAAPVPPAFAAVGATGGPAVALSDGSKFPVASFGLQVYDDDKAQKYTELALACGYRNFFASVLAGNQKGFGRAMRASGLRDECYICGSVLSNRAAGYDAAYAASKRGCDENLAALDCGPLDMILLDYPGPDAASIAGQWRALEAMRGAGNVKSLAVSNFSPAQLDVVLNLDGLAARPQLNQLPLGVGYKVEKNAKYLAENKKRGVLVQAWSPLRVLSAEARLACATVGLQYGRSASQVALKWIEAKGATFACQTTSKAHFLEDIDLDFRLTAADLRALDAV